MARETEDFGRVEGVEEVHDVQVEVLLKPNYVTFSAMKNLQEM